MSNIPEDLLQDIARSSYADMLNDDERNRAYDQAIRICVSTLVKSSDYNPHGDRFFKCCDIGTGSGLLSMMIVRAFKELRYEKFSVTAFESFQPMASCAQKVISRAGMLDYITVIPTSSDLVDENPSFDLLVAELLDTELIGEGCLEIYKHAVEFLCSPTCLFVPYKARIYIEPIASWYLYRRHALEDVHMMIREQKLVDVMFPDEIKNCCGLAVIDDMQLSAIHKGLEFKRITEPQIAFQIIFSDPDSLSEKDFVEVIFQINRKPGNPIVVAMWWDIVMYNPDSVDTKLVETFPVNLEVLSCAPVWARSEELLIRDNKIRDIYKREVWREHWIQGVYYFSDNNKTRELSKNLQVGDVLQIFAYRDSHSLWFQLEPSEETDLPPNCHCGIHRALSRSQISFLNDQLEMRKFFDPILISNNIKDRETKCTVRFKQRPAGKTILVDDAPKWFVDLRCGTIIDFSFSDELSWEKVMARTIDGLSIDPIDSFEIKFSQVHFENLNRIRTKVDKCEGFDLRPLDEMINQSIRIIDNAFESHYLWEYGGKRLGGRDYILFSSTTMEIDRRKIISGNYKQRFRLPIKDCMYEKKRGWALVFWAEFKMKSTGDIISTGPTNTWPSIRELDQSHERYGDFTWSRHCKQIVYFMHEHDLSPEAIERQEIPVDISLKRCYLDIEFPDQ